MSAGGGQSFDCVYPFVLDLLDPEPKHWPSQYPYRNSRFCPYVCRKYESASKGFYKLHTGTGTVTEYCTNDFNDTTNFNVYRLVSFNKRNIFRKPK
jgi:hypothetical protein